MGKHMYYGTQTKQIVSEYTNFRNIPIALIGRTWILMSYKPKKEKKNQSKLLSYKLFWMMSRIQKNQSLSSQISAGLLWDGTAPPRFEPVEHSEVGLHVAAPGRWDTGDPENMGLTPSFCKVTAQAGSLKNTVTNIFIYQNRRVLEICLFFESTPKEAANFLPQLCGWGLNISHSNFFPQQLV